jgi:hypothetical protein
LLEVRYIPHTPFLHIGQHPVKPLAVKTMLKLNVFHKMKCACRGSWPEVLPNPRNFSNRLSLSGDPGSQPVRNQGQVAELQKKHCTVKCLGNRALGGKLLVQKLLKSALPAGRYPVNRAHAAAGYALLPGRCD